MTMADYERCCRFCLKETSEFAVNIFKEENGPSLAKNLNGYLWVDLTDYPKWPHFACFDCVEFVVEMIKFSTKVRSSFSTLKRVLGIRGAQREKKRINLVPRATVVIDDDDGDDVKTNHLTEDMELGEESKDQPSVNGKNYPDPRIVSVYQKIKEETIPSEENLLESAVKNETIAELSIVEQLQETSTEYYLIIEGDDNTDKFSDIIEYVTDEKDNKTSTPESQETVTESPREEIMDQSDEGPKPITKKHISKARLSEKPVKPCTEEEERLEALILDMKLFECRLCGEDTQTLSGLNTHVAQKHSDISYEICCKVKAPAERVKLFDHIRFHLDKDAFKCQQCKYRGPTAANLRYHMQNNHSDKPPKFICHICGTGLRSNWKLKEHRKFHDKSLCDVCPYCQNAFASERSLIEHIQKQHEKVVNFLCDLCGKGFPSQSSLNCHIMDHGGPHGGRRKKKPRPRTTFLPHNKKYFDSK